MGYFKLEVGKFYKTRNGNKARIYALDGGDECTVHGAVSTPCGWRQGEWNLIGFCSSLEREYDYDIVAPWVDKPIVQWGKFPKYIVALAMDADGTWWGYTAEPIERNLVSWVVPHITEYDFYLRVRPGDEPEFFGDWRNSLVVRPGYKEV